MSRRRHARSLWVALAIGIGSTGCHLVLGYEETDGFSTGGGSSEGGKGGDGGCTGEILENEFTMSPVTETADDFGNLASTLSRWGARYLTRNEGGFDDTSSTVRTCNGELLLYPGKATSSTLGYFWYQRQSGPFVYQLVDGDFAIEVSIRSEHLGNTVDSFTGASIVVRNPNAISHWSEYLLGYGSLSNGLGTFHRWHNGVLDDVKETFTTSAARAGRLLVCRINGTFSHHRQLENDPYPISETTAEPADLQMGGEQTLEVGLSAVWFVGMGLGTVGVFDNVTFHPPPATHAACGELLRR